MESTVPGILGSKNHRLKLLALCRRRSPLTVCRNTVADSEGLNQEPLVSRLKREEKEEEERLGEAWEKQSGRKAADRRKEGRRQGGKGEEEEGDP